MTQNIPLAALDSIRGGLVVSVQARAGSPLRPTPIIAALTGAILEAGPAGLRINGPDDIRAVRGLTVLPIIGIHKVHTAARNIITPDIELAIGVTEAGADIIAVDATREVLGDDFSFIAQVAKATGLPVMADVSTFEEGLRAWDAGADVVGTTLSGYTPDSAPAAAGPDLMLVSRLAEHGVRVIGEGRYRSRADVKDAFDRGAHSVVVGGAITDPATIAAELIAETPANRMSAR